jgi:hypothetical protein
MNEPTIHAANTAEAPEHPLDSLGPWYNYEAEDAVVIGVLGEQQRGKLEKIFQLPVADRPHCRVHALPKV